VDSRLGYPYAVTDQDLLALAPAAHVRSAWLRLADDADVTTVLTDVRSPVAGLPDASVDGSAPERAQLTQVLDILLWVVTGLLGISVLIAVVGIGNTLSLSVLERTRESGLLRALGLTRGQLKAMLAAEAVLLATVGAVLGSLLGIGYGWAAARCLFGSRAVVLTIPWDRLGLVAAGALAAGLLASVLPARRAAKVPPAAALANDW
jgi:putative ABC transport system permease protein